MEKSDLQNSSDSRTQHSGSSNGSAYPQPVPVVRKRFSDLSSLIGEIHGLCDDLEKEGTLDAFLPSTAFHWMRLGIHEWIANLIQHANFEDREPDISIEMFPGDGRVHCIVEDNSDGFDLEKQIMIQREAQLSIPPPDRGMGLLMLKACSERVSYQTSRTTKQRLEFTVSADHEPCLNIQY